MKVWVEIPKDSRESHYVFQSQPQDRGFDFGYDNGSTGWIISYHPSDHEDIVSYLRAYTYERRAVARSDTSLLYEAEL